MDTDRIPLEGETVIGNNYHTTHGGKGSNMAACISRLDGNSTFMGKIGRDSFGESFLELLKDEGVNNDGVLYSDKLPTAVGFIVSSSSGSNIIIIDIAANGEFSPEDIDKNKSIIEQSDVILSPLEIPFDTAIHATKLAKGNGIKSILNPAPAIDLTNENLESVFVITPNETEGRVCLGLDPQNPISDEEVVQKLLELGPENVILTLGEKGVLWASEAGVKSTPALNVDVLDTVGAGDAFNSGLAVGLSENKSLEESIAMGVTAASISTQYRETIESYPKRSEVDARIQEILQ
jgi:ribokinase